MTTAGRRDISAEESVELLRIALRALVQVSKDPRTEVRIGGSVGECGEVWEVWGVRILRIALRVQVSQDPRTEVGGGGTVWGGVDKCEC